MALGTGADVALDAADVTLLRGDLAGVHRTLGLARATVATIRQNLFRAFVYNKTNSIRPGRTPRLKELP
jgi:Cu+-exporting ATPase